MTDDPNYEVKNPEIERTMRKLAEVIDRALPKHLPRQWGFAVFLFEFGPDGAMFYASNGNRADVQSLLMEYLTRAGHGAVTPTTES